jgi:hypothetical protein
MGVVIEEIEANVVSDTVHEGGGGGEPPAAAGDNEQSMLDLLALMQERKARLAVD